MTLFVGKTFWENLVYTKKVAVSASAAVAAIYLAVPAVGAAANTGEDSAGALEMRRPRVVSLSKGDF